VVSGNPRTLWLTCVCPLLTLPRPRTPAEPLPPAANTASHSPPPLLGWLRGGRSPRGSQALAQAPSPPSPPAPPPPLPPAEASWDGSWQPRSTPLFQAGAPTVPPWARPEWLPAWADPGDPSSALRRWLLPFLVAPFLAAQAVKLGALTPLLRAELARGGGAAFALNAEQQERCEEDAQRYRAHLSFEALLGDATFVVAASLKAAASLPEIAAARCGFGSTFFKLDSSRQAFLLLLLSDVLVGYHSSEGWATALELLSRHYGLAENSQATALFIAVVPVALDVSFKFWCFKSLRELSPDTQVILEDIDRH